MTFDALHPPDCQPPANRDKYERMIKAMRAVDNPKALEALSVAYILDLSYPRQDIVLALWAIEKEKGWR